MKNFKTIFKTKADEKTLTREDMATLCLLRAIAAKSEAKEAIARHFVSKAFTPSKVYGYRSVNQAARIISDRFRYRNQVLGVPFTEIFDTDEEIQMFKSMLPVIGKYS